jgi:hypothetical protein
MKILTAPILATAAKQWLSLSRKLGRISSWKSHLAQLSLEARPKKLLMRSAAKIERLSGGYRGVAKARQDIFSEGGMDSTTI